MIFIILGSLPFIAYIKFISGNRKIFFSDIQMKTFLKIIVVSFIVLSIYLLINDENNLILSSILFTTISILSGIVDVTAELE